MVFPCDNNSAEDTAATEYTQLLDEPSLSLPSAPNTPAKKKVDLPVEAVGNFKPEPRENISPNDDGSSLTNTEPFTLRWSDEEGYMQCISMSQTIIKRLKESYSFGADSFLATLRNYLKRKYFTAEFRLLPLLLPNTFFYLCKEVMNIQYEFCSDALSCSGVLKYYCSSDLEDTVFGSQGSWEEMEDKIEAGAGIPVSDSQVVWKNFAKRMERNMMRPRKYCKVLLLPLVDEEISAIRRDETFMGEIVVVIPAKYIHFLRHNIDVFRDGYSPHSDPDWKPPQQLAVIIWMNELYRIAHSPPQDVEECFGFWALHTFKTHELVDYGGVFRCFPPRTRSLEYRELVLQDVSNS